LCSRNFLIIKCKSSIKLFIFIFSFKTSFSFRPDHFRYRIIYILKISQIFQYQYEITHTVELTFILLMGGNLTLFAPVQHILGLHSSSVAHPLSISLWIRNSADWCHSVLPLRTGTELLLSGETVPGTGSDLCFVGGLLPLVCNGLVFCHE
jgi:hypothetical protein